MKILKDFSSRKILNSVNKNSDVIAQVFFSIIFTTIGRIKEYYNDKDNDKDNKNKLTIFKLLKSLKMEKNKTTKNNYTSQSFKMLRIILKEEKLKDFVKGEKYYDLKKLRTSKKSLNK